MILIADSGSTKTDWWVIPDHEPQYAIQTTGINPYLCSQSQIENILNKELIPAFRGENTIAELYFYGAGCSSERKKGELYNIFKGSLSLQKLTIEGDLLAACRALCGNRRGLVGILGTGSNSCLYDGTKISKNIASLGYVLCDEGSGAEIGKTLLRAYLREDLPLELQKAFEERYPGNENDFLENVYQKPNANRYLASFSYFAFEYKEHPFMLRQLEEIFSGFFTQQLCRYPDSQRSNYSIVGSIGYHFQEIIRAVGEKHHLTAGRFLRSPMEGLIQFHQKKS